MNKIAETCLKPVTILVVGLAALAAALLVEWLSHGVMPMTVPTLGATALVVLLYTSVTARIHETSSDNTTMACFTQIHTVMSSDSAYEHRRVLHEQGPRAWKDLATPPARKGSNTEHEQQVMIRTHISGLLNPGNKPTLVGALGNITPHPQTRAEFHRVLRAHASQFPIGGLMNLPEAIEQTLIAMDIITLPYAYRVAQAEAALMAYGPVFDRTAKVLLPFVAMEMYLRGQREYKYHYLLSMQALGERGALSLDEQSSAYLKALLNVVDRPPGETDVRPLTSWRPDLPIRRRTYRSALDARRLVGGPLVVAIGAHASEVICALDEMWKSREIKCDQDARRQPAEHEEKRHV